jgi:putative endonuclease
MYYTYAIKSVENNWIYAGITDNPDRRLMQHNKGQNKSTAPYKPFFLFHIEEFQSRPEARMREKYFKSAAGKRFLRKILEELQLNSNSCRPV